MEIAPHHDLKARQRGNQEVSLASRDLTANVVRPTIDGQLEDGPLSSVSENLADADSAGKAGPYAILALAILLKLLFSPSPKDVVRKILSLFSLARLAILDSSATRKAKHFTEK